tara:strand:- start:50 stop:682 length:633 start_codon:yes stop_codon:yes gene_type:complete
VAKKNKTMAFKMNKNKPGSLYNKTARKNSTSFTKIEDSSSMKRMQDYIIKDGKPVAISTEEFDKRLKEGATFTDIPSIRDLEGMTEQQKRYRGAGEGKLLSDKETGIAREISRNTGGEGTYTIVEKDGKTQIKPNILSEAEGGIPAEDVYYKDQQFYENYGKDMGFPNPKETRKDIRRFDQDYYGSYDARKQEEINKREAERKRNQGKKN